MGGARAGEVQNGVVNIDRVVNLGGGAYGTAFLGEDISLIA
jgi:hypothetical protein